MMQDNNERAREVVAEKPFSVIVIINEKEWKEGEHCQLSSGLSFSLGPNSNEKRIVLSFCLINCFSFCLSSLTVRKKLKMEMDFSSTFELNWAPVCRPARPQVRPSVVGDNSNRRSFVAEHELGSFVEARERASERSSAGMRSSVRCCNIRLIYIDSRPKILFKLALAVIHFGFWLCSKISVA